MSLPVTVTYRDSSLRFEFRQDLKLQDNIALLCDMLKAGNDPNSTVPIEAFGLKNKGTGVYINQENFKGSEIKLDEEFILVNMSEDALESVCAIELDKDDQIEDNLLKRAVFLIKENLKMDYFAEELISHGGVEALIRVIRAGDNFPNLQAYGMQALNRVLVFKNGFDKLESQTQLLEELFVLLTCRNPNVVKQVVSLLFVLAEMSSKGFDLVTGAACSVALKNDADKAQNRSTPYLLLLSLLTSGDLDVQINTLTLINVLLSKNDVPASRRRILHQSLEEGGLYSILENVCGLVAHHEFVSEIDKFERITGELFYAGHFKLEWMRSKYREMQEQLQERDVQLRRAQSQLSLLDVLLRENHHLSDCLRTAQAKYPDINTTAPLVRIEDSKDDVTISDNLVSNLMQRKLNTNESSNEHKLPLQEKESETVSEKKADVITDKITDEAQKDQSQKPTSEETKEAGHSTGNQPSSEESKEASQSTGDQVSSDVSSAGIPPPPPMGDAPPPPPMGFNAISAPREPLKPQPTKPEIKPKKKLLRLHWQRIILDPKKEKNTIWHQIADITGQLNSEEIETEFARKTAALADGEVHFGGGHHRGASSKKLLVRALSEQTSNKIAILLQTTKLQISEIKQSVEFLDPRIMSIDILNLLLTCLPTENDIKSIEKVKASGTHGMEWDKPEQFCMLVTSIPQLKERFRCLQISLSFGTTETDSLANLEMILNLCTQLRKNSTIKRLFEIVLAVGNYLNGGTPSGQADGFDLTILNKLNSTKSSSGSNLLGYIAKYCMAHLQSVYQLPDQFAILHDATKLSPVSEILNAVKRLEIDAQYVRSNAWTLISSPLGKNDRFPRHMKPFVDSLGARLATLTAAKETASKAYSDLINYFLASDEYPTAKSNQLFSVMDTFFNNIREEMKRIETESKRSPRNSPKLQANPITRKHRMGEKLINATQIDMSDVIQKIKQKSINLHHVDKKGLKRADGDNAHLNQLTKAISKLNKTK